MGWVGKGGRGGGGRSGGEGGLGLVGSFGGGGRMGAKRGKSIWCTIACAGRGRNTCNQYQLIQLHLTIFSICVVFILFQQFCVVALFHIFSIAEHLIVAITCPTFSGQTGLRIGRQGPRQSCISTWMHQIMHFGHHMVGPAYHVASALHYNKCMQANTRQESTKFPCLSLQLLR